MATMTTSSIINLDISKDELSLVRSYLLLTFIHKVFERDCRVISKSGLFKSPQIYMELVSSATKKTLLMLQEVTRELTSHDLKVTNVRQDQRGVEAQYFCRGVQGELSILWPSFRREMLLRMRAYLGLSTELSILSRDESSGHLALTI